MQKTTSLRQALDAIKENIVLLLVESDRLTFTDITKHETFKHTAQRDISIALEEMVFERTIMQDKDGKYFIVTD